MLFALAHIVILGGAYVAFRVSLVGAWERRHAIGQALRGKW